MDDLDALLHRAASAAAGYRAGPADRLVRAAPGTEALRPPFGGPVADEPMPAADVVHALVAAADAGLVSAGPRFFGLVIGAALDAGARRRVLADGSPAPKARRLAAGGAEIANQAVLNQVPAGFAADQARTDRIVEEVQRDGTCWLGGTTWRGRRLVRVSVSDWSTAEADVDRSVEAILAAAART